ncbi:T6SS effector amidase Tae4 family protein [Empedobacter brevis]|uniref:T6SS effector amidase Tae4 family protein n=1 Tax=Empedobacter brevis TaxID=247 RepID=UPI0028ADEBEB|nr:T6SS effector amidase Tae4 family protein [Empedobacter brevis]
MRNSGLLTILFSTVPRGLSARLTRGNFWQGAHTGLIVSALNHATQHFRARPKYESVRKGYPTNSDGTDDMETSEVFKSVFGENYDTNTFKNACATRCSIGLNEAGEPVRKDFLGSVGKMKGKGIIASAVWMTKTYGNPDVKIANPSSFDEVSNAINGRRGIYIMEPKKGAFSSPLISGHATLWNGNDAIGGHNYISSAKMIYFWSLK